MAEFGILTRKLNQDAVAGGNSKGVVNTTAVHSLVDGILEPLV
jgi:hypothetical protein